MHTLPIPDNHDLNEIKMQSTSLQRRNHVSRAVTGWMMKLKFKKKKKKASKGENKPVEGRNEKLDEQLVYLLMVLRSQCS